MTRMPAAGDGSLADRTRLFGDAAGRVAVPSSQDVHRVHRLSAIQPRMNSTIPNGQAPARKP